MDAKEKVHPIKMAGETTKGNFFNIRPLRGRKKRGHWRIAINIRPLQGRKKRGHWRIAINIRPRWGLFSGVGNSCFS